MKKIIIECEDEEVEEILEDIKQVIMRRDPMNEPFCYIEDECSECGHLSC